MAQPLRERHYASCALELHDRDASAGPFGELLASCAGCHAMIRDR